MNEFIKKNQKILFVIGLIIICIFVTFSALIHTAKLRLNEASCPASLITDGPRILPDTYEEYSELDMCVRCAGTGYTIWLPSDADVKDEMVEAKVDDIHILVTVSDMGMDYVLNNVIPQELYFSVLGYEPETDIIKEKSGYLYQYPASYAVSISNAKISVRTVTCYCMTYAIAVSQERSIYIAVSCEKKADIERAQELLDDIASSVRQYDALEPEIQDVMMPDDMLIETVENTPEPVAKESGTVHLDISFNSSFDREVQDGILVIMWENYMVSPSELIVFGPDGYQLQFLEEESTSGFYAYRVGNSQAGTYTVKGLTDTALIDVYVELYESEEYDSIFGE